MWGNVKQTQIQTEGHLHNNQSVIFKNAKAMNDK